MFLEKLLHTRNDAGKLHASVAKLFRKAGPNEVFTLPQLAERVRPDSVDQLAEVLAALLKEEIVDQIFRVESPKYRGGIDDYPTLKSVPPTIWDLHQGRNIEVEPNMIRVLFKKHSNRPIQSGAGVKGARAFG